MSQTVSLAVYVCELYINRIILCLFLCSYVRSWPMQTRRLHWWATTEIFPYLLVVNCWFTWPPLHNTPCPRALSWDFFNSLHLPEGNSHPTQQGVLGPSSHTVLGLPSDWTVTMATGCSVLRSWICSCWWASLKFIHSCWTVIFHNNEYIAVYVSYY